MEWTLPRVHRVGLDQGRVAMGRRQRKSSYNGGASSVSEKGGDSNTGATKTDVCGSAEYM